MSTLAFENLKCTTATLIVHNEGTINLDAAYSLLPITRIDLPVPKRQSQKYKIPFVEGQAGAILSLRYKGATRGIIRSTGGKYFKNSITCDTTCQSKNVSIKISGSKFQLCGCSSVAQGGEAAEYIIKHLLDIQDHLDLIQSDLPRARATIEWLAESTRGESTYRFSSEKPAGHGDKKEESSEGGKGDGKKHKKSCVNLVLVEPDFSVRLPSGWTDAGYVGGVPKFLPPGEGDSPSESETSESLSGTDPGGISETSVEMPENVDTRLACFMLRFIRDFAYHSDYISELTWMLSVPQVVTRDIKLISCVPVMCNYNFDCSFGINRFELARCFANAGGWYSRYNNSLEHAVTLNIKYEPSPDQRSKRKNKRYVSTILVYLSGLCTLSAPNEQEAKRAYELFMTTLNSVRDQVFKDTGPRRLKYRPVQKRTTSPETAPGEIQDKTNTANQVAPEVIQRPPAPTPMN